uniref:Uncharacterized protein n=1 Tax=Xenopus tropicalis TaxID=8364 RepID=A0A1B8Y1P8_XENTR
MTQSRVPVGSATQTGGKEGSWAPGRAPVPEPVLGGGLVVRVQEGLLMVPVAPKAATNQRVCPEGQGMWVEPSSLCWYGTGQVSADQVGIDWGEGGQTVSEFRPREWGTRDRQEGPTCTQVTAGTEGNQVGAGGQVPTGGNYGLWPSTHTGTPCREGKNNKGLNSVRIFLQPRARDHGGKDPKGREFRPGG